MKWIPVGEQMPEAEKAVIATANVNKRAIVIRAIYVPKFTVEV